jgi:hypothetical protein
VLNRCTFTFAVSGIRPSSGSIRSFWRGTAASVRELNEIRRIIVEQQARIIEAWHEHCDTAEATIRRVEVTDETITAHLADGRVISVPLAWSWRLSDATPAQRAKWELIGDGAGVHWPDVDEDISAEGIVAFRD